MVPHPEEGHEGEAQLVAPRQQLVRPPAQQLVLGSAAGGVVVGDPVGGELGAVGAPPAKGGRGDVLLLGTGAHEHIGADARGRQKLGEGAGVPEGVDVVPDGGGDAQVPGQEPLTVEELPAHRLARGQVAVRLDPLAAGDHPAPGAHQLADAGEQLGRGLHDPAVVAGRAGREAEIGVLVQALDGGPERLEDLVHALVPVPDPHGVDVGVPDHEEAGSGRHDQQCRDEHRPGPATAG